jgi:hypothetical protein
VNRFVHRAETRVDVMDAAAESARRHKRMILNDQVVRLRAAA